MTDLKHFGVLGMKWGIRKRGPSSSDHMETQTLRKKGVNELTNDELKKLNTRLQLEKQLKDLTASDGKRGKKLVSKFLNSRLGQLALGIAFKKIKDIFDARTGAPNADNVPNEVIDAILLEDEN